MTPTVLPKDKSDIFTSDWLGESGIDYGITNFLPIFIRLLYNYIYYYHLFILKYFFIFHFHRILYTFYLTDVYKKGQWLHYLNNYLSRQGNLSIKELKHLDFLHSAWTRTEKLI